MKLEKDLLCSLCALYGIERIRVPAKRRLREKCMKRLALSSFFAACTIKSTLCVVYTLLQSNSTTSLGLEHPMQHLAYFWHLLVLLSGGWN